MDKIARYVPKMKVFQAVEWTGKNLDEIKKLFPSAEIRGDGPNIEIEHPLIDHPTMKYLYALPGMIIMLAENGDARIYNKSFFEKNFRPFKKVSSLNLKKKVIWKNKAGDIYIFKDLDSAHYFFYIEKIGRHLPICTQKLRHIINCMPPDEDLSFEIPEADIIIAGDYPHELKNIFIQILNGDFNAN